MEMETEDDVDALDGVDGNADSPSSAIPLVTAKEFQPEIAEIAPAGKEELLAS
jgi:hypothetical protein